MPDSSSFAWDKPVRTVLGDPSSAAVMEDGKPKAKFPLINGPCEAYHDMNLWCVVHVTCAPRGGQPCFPIASVNAQACL